METPLALTRAFVKPLNICHSSSVFCFLDNKSLFESSPERKTVCSRSTDGIFKGFLKVSI
jgi:hypothetical protein